MHPTLRDASLFTLAAGAVFGGHPAHAAASDFVDVKDIVPSVLVDTPYASKANVFKTRFYTVNRAFLRRGTALKLAKAQRTLRAHGLRLKVWDAYRPRSVQWAMWRVIQDARYVAPPGPGSRHARGAAVDVTLVNAKGRELEMPSAFDDFSVRAHANYNGASRVAKHNRAVLRAAMIGAGFTPLRHEWWHFNDPQGGQYQMTDITLTELAARTKAAKRR